MPDHHYWESCDTRGRGVGVLVLFLSIHPIQVGNITQFHKLCNDIQSIRTQSVMLAEDQIDFLRCYFMNHVINVIKMYILTLMNT